MSYIGNAPRFSDFPYYSNTGDGTTTSYPNIGWTPPSQNSVIVFVGGVQQRQATDFSISGTALTFTSAPPNGSSIYVYGWGQLGLISTVAYQIAAGAVTPAGLSTGGPSWDTSSNLTVTGNLTVNGSAPQFNSTAALLIPKGTVAQRPSASQGLIRLNTDSTQFEGCADGSNWKTLGSITSAKAYFLRG